jgi:2-phosphoglycerate kinase
MPLLDTQKIADDLIAAGVNASQARVFASKMEEAAHAIRADLATKADVAEIKQELQSVRQEMQMMRVELRGEIKDMINRFTFIMVGLIGLAVAILRLWK